MKDKFRTHEIAAGYFISHAFPTEKIPVRSPPATNADNTIMTDLFLPPYCGKLEKMTFQDKVILEPQTVNILKSSAKRHFPINTKTRFDEAIRDNMEIYETELTAPDERTYPQLITNPTDNSFTFPEDIGYWQFDLTCARNPTRYVILNFQEFLQLLADTESLDRLDTTDLHKLDGCPTADVNELDHTYNPHHHTAPKRGKFTHTPKSDAEVDREKEIKSQQRIAKFKEYIYQHRLNINLSEEDLKFLSKFPFDAPQLDPNDTVRLWKELLNNKKSYSQHKYDLGKVNHEFSITLKDDATFVKQRPSKIPINWRNKVLSLLDKLIAAGIIEEMGNENPKDLGSEFINPLILLPKDDTLKLVIDARALNKMTRTWKDTWPVEPVSSQLDRVHGIWFSTTDMSFAYGQIPLHIDTRPLVSFCVEGFQYQYKRGFYGLQGLPGYFSRIMNITFRDLIRKKQALAYLDDLLLMAESKEEMFYIIHQYHIALAQSGMKATPEKTFFFQQKVQFLGHTISEKGIQPLHDKIKALQELKVPESKKALKSVVGSLNYYSKFVKNLTLNFKPFHILLEEKTPWEWTPAHEKLFHAAKSEMSKETTLTPPNPDYPCEVQCDASNCGVGAILTQIKPDGTRILCSYDSRVFDNSELRMPTILKEIAAIVWALEKYEHYLIGSKHPIIIYTDHKPILYLFSKKGNMNHRFLRFQQIMTKFYLIQLKWTAGKNLVFPDMLSRNFTEDELVQLKLQNKKLPENLEFIDENNNTIHYEIDRYTFNNTDDKTDSHPIAFQKNGKKYTTTILCTQNQYTEPIEVNEIEFPQYEPLQTYFTNNFHERKLLYNRIYQKDLQKHKAKSLKQTIQAIDSPNISPTLQKNNVSTIHAITHQLPPTIDTTTAFTLMENFANTEITLELLLREQQNDPIISEITKWIIAKTVPPYKYTDLNKDLKHFKNKFNDLLINTNNLTMIRIEADEEPHEITTRIILPQQLLLAVFKKAHDDKLTGHFGVKKTLAKIQLQYYRPGLIDYIRALANDCQNCQLNKHKPKDTAELLNPKSDVTEPNDTLHIDFKGPFTPASFGCKYILVIVDAFSNFVYAEPTRNATALAAVTVLEKHCLLHDFPRIIISDRGTHFTGNEFQQFCQTYNIKSKLLSGYVPWANGLVENMNKILGTYLRQFTTKTKKNWAKSVSQFTYAYNTSVLTENGLTPYEITFGTKPKVPVTLKLGTLSDQHAQCLQDDCPITAKHTHYSTTPKPATESLLDRQNRFSKIYARIYHRSKMDSPELHATRNIHKAAAPLEIGQHVTVENKTINPDISKKLLPLRDGLYKVIKQLNQTTYKIEHITSKKTLNRHRNLLLPYNPRKSTIPPLITNRIGTTLTPTRTPRLQTPRTPPYNPDPCTPNKSHSPLVQFMPNDTTHKSSSSSPEISPNISYQNQHDCSPPHPFQYHSDTNTSPTTLFDPYSDDSEIDDCPPSQTSFTQHNRTNTNISFDDSDTETIPPNRTDPDFQTTHHNTTQSDNFIFTTPNLSPENPFSQAAQQSLDSPIPCAQSSPKRPSFNTRSDSGIPHSSFLSTDFTNPFHHSNNTTVLPQQTTQTLQTPSQPPQQNSPPITRSRSRASRPQPHIAPPVLTQTMITPPEITLPDSHFTNYPDNSMLPYDINNSVNTSFNDTFLTAPHDDSYHSTQATIHPHEISDTAIRHRIHPTATSTPFIETHSHTTIPPLYPTRQIRIRSKSPRRSNRLQGIPARTSSAETSKQPRTIAPRRHRSTSKTDEPLRHSLRLIRTPSKSNPPRVKAKTTTAAKRLVFGKPQINKPKKSRFNSKSPHKPKIHEIYYVDSYSSSDSATDTDEIYYIQSKD